MTIGGPLRSRNQLGAVESWVPASAGTTRFPPNAVLSRQIALEPVANRAQGVLDRQGFWKDAAPRAQAQKSQQDRSRKRDTARIVKTLTE
ncbi:MAG TPA: hypothetical protein VGF07_14385, partial [Stellaceae bacterium]